MSEHRDGVDHVERECAALAGLPAAQRLAALEKLCHRTERILGRAVLDTAAEVYEQGHDAALHRSPYAYGYLRRSLGFRAEHRTDG
ncbi:hypothetical protein Kpho02_00420 [Kitasatospora phosalacinea]|uniref:Uncharacterized protein n=1 Tax=Kitasatospora phosalacinea TaxID=2065 RepID=A0A9W6UZ02_9ACTN|nr:hypothetical protein [Kitasatospora phosalacinea]GLW67743.1 hypothetical protein Kpho02_00420 [Kitasatospora phosalacinea]